jgi:hypothetical protein
MRAYSRPILIVLITSLALVSISNISLAWASDPNVVNILRQLGFTNIVETTDETFPTGIYDTTLYAEFADFHDRNNLTWYPEANTAAHHYIFLGPEGNQGFVNPPISKLFTASEEFGLSFESPEATYFTETRLNNDSLKHAMIYINLDDRDMYLIGFENLYGVGDKDYDDMVVSLELVAPVVNVAGVNWYILNRSSDKAMLYLDGGPGGDIWGWDYDGTSEELSFLIEMFGGGFDVLFNKDLFSYAHGRIVRDVATWLLSHGYAHVYLFGWSSGGLFVSWEVTEEHASYLYSAVVVSSAPVVVGYAPGDRVATCFIEGEDDDRFINCMLAYYDSTIVHKEWHIWDSDHIIFGHTCKETGHTGETVAAATMNWFNAAHPPNTPLTPSGQQNGYVYTSYSYSSGTIDPNGDYTRYKFDWDDGTTGETNYSPQAKT